MTVCLQFKADYLQYAMLFKEHDTNYLALTWVILLAKIQDRSMQKYNHGETNRIYV